MPFTIIITVMTRPKIVNNILGSAKSPIPISVASLFTMIFEFCNPTNVMNKPIPAPTAYFNSAGIALIIVSRIPVNERRIKITPATKTTS